MGGGGDGGWRMEDGRGGVGGTHNNSLQPLRLLELASLFEKTTILLSFSPQP